MVRRLHDIKLSGWFVLIWFIPYVNIAFGLIVGLWPSDKEWNKWGE